MHKKQGGSPLLLPVPTLPVRNLMLYSRELYPNFFHPMETSLKRDYSGFAKHYTRTRRPPKHYFIDFGLSRRCDPADNDPMDVPIWGGDKEVPECQNSNEPCNLFPTEVFYIGSAIRKDFIEVSQPSILFLLFNPRLYTCSTDEDRL